MHSGERRAVEKSVKGIPKRGRGVGAEGTRAVGIWAVPQSGGAEVKVGGQGGGPGAEAEEAEGRVVRESAEGGGTGGSEEVAAQEFRRGEGEVGVEAGGGGGRGREGTEVRVPEGRDASPKRAGIGALSVRGESAEDTGGGRCARGGGS